MPTDATTPTTWLVWCLGRPHLNRVHTSHASAERDADALARAYPNHRFDVYQLVGTHMTDSAYGATRGQQRPPGTQDF